MPMFINKSFKCISRRTFFVGCVSLSITRVFLLLGFMFSEFGSQDLSIFIEIYSRTFWDIMSIIERLVFGWHGRTHHRTSLPELWIHRSDDLGLDLLSVTFQLKRLVPRHGTGRVKCVHERQETRPMGHGSHGTRWSRCWAMLCDQYARVQDTSHTQITTQGHSRLRHLRHDL